MGSVVLVSLAVQRRSNAGPGAAPLPGVATPTGDVPEAVEEVETDGNLEFFFVTN